MKKLFFAFSFCTCCLGIAQSTTDNSNLKIDELRAPSSPGFSILGVQPTEISRPKSLRSLETTLANSFLNNSQLIVPKDFAMEFIPFFATRRYLPDNSPSYVFGNQRTNVGFNLKANSAISVATGMFNNFYDTSFKNPRMGLGYRTQVFSMRPTTEGLGAYKMLVGKAGTITLAIESVQVLQDDTTKLNGLDADGIIASYKNQFRTDFKSTATTGGVVIDTSYLMGYLDAIVAPEVEQMQKDKKSLQVILARMSQLLANMTEESSYVATKQDVKAALRQRYGSCLEFATAFLIDFPTNDIYFSKVPKWATWVTYTYRCENQKWEMGGLFRYTRSKFDTISGYNNIDLGGRLQFGGERWNVNAELIQRWQWEVVDTKPADGGHNDVTFRINSDFKMALTVNYMLSDDIVLNYTFGNKLKVNTEFENESNMISSLGVSYAFGGPRLKDVK